MKKYLLIISLIFITLSFFVKEDALSLDKISNTDDYCISDSRQSDVEAIFNLTNAKGIVSFEMQSSLSVPSFRIIPSQKKTQQQSINNILLKRFSSEVQPTKNYNTKFSSPLSSNDDLIVIVRHLII